MRRVLYLHNYTMTPSVVVVPIMYPDKIVITKVSIKEEGIYTPVTRLLKIGMLYPTPWGVLTIMDIKEGCLIFIP